MVLVYSKFRSPFMLSKIDVHDFLYLSLVSLCINGRCIINNSEPDTQNRSRQSVDSTGGGDEIKDHSPMHLNIILKLAKLQRSILDYYCMHAVFCLT